MTDKRYALDTNVLIYLHDKVNTKKRAIAERLVAGRPGISTQVVSEYINVTKRLLDIPKEQLVIECAELFEQCFLIPITYEVLTESVRLVKRFDLQVFDSLIVASCSLNGCTVLYSEDMQHGQTINGMTIINPFTETK